MIRPNAQTPLDPATDAALLLRRIGFATLALALPLASLVSRWAARHGVAMAEWPAEPVDPFFNANQPDDLAEAERLYAMLGNA